MPPTQPKLTRRALGTGLAGAAAAAGFAPGASAAPHHTVLSDPDLREAALRGLATAGHRGDTVAAAAAEATLARLERSDPEGAILVRIYRLLDNRPSASSRGHRSAAATADLALLHEALRASRAVAFRYTDLEGNRTTRSVLPLALVHPPQGTKLLAWCAVRADYRQFFVDAIRGPTLQPGEFSARRLALLQGLLDHHMARA
jgi:predicted DNA-binding transcriptional regulator YafY